MKTKIKLVRFRNDIDEDKIPITKDIRVVAKAMRAISGRDLVP